MERPQAKKTKKSHRKFASRRNLLLDAQWTASYQQAAKLYARDGQSWWIGLPKEPKLNKWVGTQRYNKRKGRLSPHREQLLNLIEFCWDANEARWMLSYDRAVELYKRDGKFWWNGISPEEPALIAWANTQRNAQREGKLSPEHRDLLNKIEFCWDAQGELWGHYYERACELFETLGPLWSRYLEELDPELYAWAYAQKSYLRGGTLDSDRKELLDEIHFQWNSYFQTWEYHFEQFKEFVQSKGFERLEEEGDPALVDWVTIQQTRRRLLNQERRRRLEEAGMPFPTRAAPVVNAWNAKLSQLQHFKESHGHADPSPEEDASLCRWICRQRSRWDNLTEQQQHSLKQVGMLLDGPKDFPTQNRPAAAILLSWDEWIAAARQFKKQHGHLRLADWKTCDELCPGLYRFARKLRRGEVEITESQRATLDELGFDWAPPDGDAFFQARLRDLAAYKEEHGHCSVPKASGRHQRLGEWVARVRAQRQTIGKLRTEQLDALGFVWNRKEERIAEQWEAQFAELLKYREAHGDCIVPIRTPGWETLALWVSRTRIARDSLTAEQVQRLDQVGFAWNVAAAAFEARYDDLKAFKETHGHCLVSASNDPTNGPLRHWIVRQRQKRKQGTMNSEHEKRLTELGFPW